jgi:tetratricopeptide (TPR) repeat protein/tRNA A-37 threonylcarbamoyl transferase component Bud32
MVLGPWVLSGVLGRGGMGVVRRAVHRDTGATAAVKTVDEPDATRVRAIQREARALAALQHPGVVRVLDDGVSEAGPWIAMELVDGTTLRHAWRDRQPPGADATLTLDLLDAIPDRKDRVAVDWIRWRPVLAQIAGTLAHVHGAGLVHGDLKPSNVLLADGRRPVLVDFGLAARLGARDSTATLAASASPAGTPAYAAPETIAGRPADARTDLYALGCMIYEALTGSPPFTGTGWAVAQRQLHAPHVPVAERVDVDPELADLVDRLLAKRPEDRPGHAARVAAWLGVVVTAPPVLFRPGLAGRDKALSDRVTAVDRLGERTGFAAVLTGPAGGGKTRLAIEAVQHARARHIRVVAGACAALDSAGRHALSALSAVLDHAAATLPEPLLGEQTGRWLVSFSPGVAARAAEQGWAAAPHVPVEVGRKAVATAVVDVVVTLASEAPLLLVVDDVQWADAVTADVLGQLVATTRSASLGVLATCRGTVPGWMANAQEVALDTLDESGTAALVADMLGTPTAPASLVAAVHRIGDGNRLGATQELPQDPGELVQWRLDSLPPRARIAMDAAAVVGDLAAPDVLARVAGLDPPAMRSAAHVLEAAGLLVLAPTGALTFAHGTVRESAYAALDPDQTTNLHRATAEALGSESAASKRAYHLERGGLLRAAYPMYRQAAQDALTHHAMEDAEAHLRAALRLASSNHHEVGTRVELATKVLAPSGRHAEAETALDAAKAGDDGSDPVQSARVAISHADCVQIVRGSEAAAPFAAHALALAQQTGDPDLLSSAWRILATVNVRAGDFSKAAEAAAESERWAKHSKNDQHALLVLYATGLLYRNSGRFLEARQAMETLISRARRGGHTRAEALGRSSLGVVHQDLDDVGAAARELEAALKGLREVGDQRHEALVLGNLAGMSFHAGRFDEAAERITAASTALRSLGDQRSAAMNDMNLGSVYESQSRWTDARAAYQLATDTLAAVADSTLPYALAALSRTNRRLGADAETIKSILDRAEAADGAELTFSRIALRTERVFHEILSGRDPRDAMIALEAAVAAIESIPSYLEAAIAEVRSQVPPD